MLTPLNLAHTPTPLYHLDRISHKWGHDIWVKRDDLTGSGLSGNKVRKLEYLLADALSHQADTIITCGAIQSNHCRATALSAARLGLNCHLILRGEETSHLDGNLLLDRLAGAQITYISEQEYYTDLDGRLNALKDRLTRDGYRPYIIVEGGSDPIGAWGYVEALREAKEQCENHDFKPDRIVVATGSGGTHAGLLVGTKREDWHVEIVSASVCYDINETRDRIFNIVCGMQDMYGVGQTIRREDISVVDTYRGSGYGEAGQDELSVIFEMASTEGILLDPTYTGKAARAIKCEAAVGRFSGTTLLWHTGGMFGLFPYRDDFDKMIDQQ